MLQGRVCETLALEALFRPLGVDLVELELQEAEAAKLFLNAWRALMLGFATAHTTCRPTDD